LGERVSAFCRMRTSQARAYGDDVAEPRTSRIRALPWVIDSGMAAAFSATAVITALTGVDDGYAGAAPAWASAVVGGLAPLPLVFRRRRPVAVLLAVVLLRGVPQLVADIDRPFLGGLVVVVVAFAACAQYARRPWNWLSILLPAALFALYAAIDPRFRTASEAGFESVLFAAGWALGTVFRVLTARNTALERELAAVALADRLRREARVAAEREHIARELHDVIAQNVTAMIVQAGSARLQLSTEPIASAAALQNVETSGREALGELRRALGLLQVEQYTGPPSASPA
jgi:signal transduction histidine kinase